MTPVEYVTSPQRDRDEPPSLEGESGECYWAHHEDASGAIPPHWHCAADCCALHLTEAEAVACPVEPPAKRATVVLAGPGAVTRQ